MSLKKWTSNVFGSPSRNRRRPVSTFSQGEYRVAEVRAERVRPDGTLEYLVRWEPMEGLPRDVAGASPEFLPWVESLEGAGLGFEPRDLAALKALNNRPAKSGRDAALLAEAIHSFTGAERDEASGRWLFDVEWKDSWEPQEEVDPLEAFQAYLDAKNAPPSPPKAKRTKRATTKVTKVTPTKDTTTKTPTPTPTKDTTTTVPKATKTKDTTTKTKATKTKTKAVAKVVAEVVAEDAGMEVVPYGLRSPSTKAALFKTSSSSPSPSVKALARRTTKRG
jgi:hypothetical protein